MKNRIAKAAADYKKLYHGRKDNEGAFYASDMHEVKEIAEMKEGYSNILYEAIETALEAGFMIGYRKALRDAKRKEKEA